ncbi:TetR/AcrR family transcriptional regulator [Streptomyces sp. NPDC002143]
MRADEAGDRARVPNRWGEGQRLRQEILEAANRLLRDTERPEEITLRGIARETGVTATAIYKHFRDKSELMWAVLDAVYEELAGTMRSAAQGAPDGDSWAALQAAVEAYWAFALMERPRYQLMFHIGPTLPTEQRPERLPSYRVMEVWQDLVHAYLAQPDADVRELPATGSHSQDRAIAQLLWTGLHGQLAMWWGVTHDRPEQALLDLRDALLLTLFGRC